MPLIHPLFYDWPPGDSLRQRTRESNVDFRPAEKPIKIRHMKSRPKGWLLACSGIYGRLTPAPWRADLKQGTAISTSLPTAKSCPAALIMTFFLVYCWTKQLNPDNHKA